MRFGQTSNPALKAEKFKNQSFAATDGEVMTIRGTINKTALMLLLIVMSATFIWNNAFSGGNVMPWVIGGAIGGLVVAIATVFKPQWAPITAPIYSILEGLVVGGVSAMYAAAFDGIVMKAVVVTFGILFTMLFVYRTGMIKVTDRFKSILTMAMGGIFLLYISSWILGMFGIQMSFLHDGGPLSILITLAIVVVASLVLVWDFDTIDKSAASGAPKYMEWYSAFSLMVTLIWLYFEVLRLIALLSGND